MEYINRIGFPSIGEKSPILNSSIQLMRRAYYIANIFIIFIIFTLWGFQQFQHSHKIMFGSNPLKNVINITYTQLGPPPSILGNDALNQSMTSTSTGTPKPVIDALAQQETAPITENINFNTINNNLTESNIRFVSFSALDIKPQPIDIPEAIYPEPARKAHIEGQVLVKGLVDINGKIIYVQVIQSSGNSSLDQAAMAAARNAKFTPAKQRDEFVRVWVSIPFKFNLNG